MEQIIIITLLFIVVLVLVAVLVIVVTKLNSLKNSSAVELIKADMVELSRSIGGLQTSVNDRLEKNNLNLQNSVQKQLSESAKLVSDVTKW